MADKYRILTLLFFRLDRLGFKPVIPQKIWLDLRKKYLANVARNLMLYGELSRIVVLLKSEQIPVIALKGLHLAQIVYHDIALRWMGDIDILVPRELAHRVWNLLLANGYQSLSGHSADCDLQIKKLHHLARLAKAGGSSVEIHWSLATSNQNESLDSESMEGIWERATPIHLGSADLLGLSPEDLLLHLCMHASYQHFFKFGLQPLCDITWMIDHFGDSLHWQNFSGQTSKWGWERGVYLALRLAHDLIGAEVPEAALNELKRDNDGNAENMVALAKEEVFASASNIQMSKDFARFWEEATFRGKLALLLKRIFLPSEVLATQYPMGPGLLNRYYYYLVRLRDLLRRYGQLTWQVLLGNEVAAGNVRRKYQLARWFAEK